MTVDIGHGMPSLAPALGGLVSALTIWVMRRSNVNTNRIPTHFWVFLSIASTLAAIGINLTIAAFCRKLPMSFNHQDLIARAIEASIAGLVTAFILVIAKHRGTSTLQFRVGTWAVLLSSSGLAAAGLLYTLALALSASLGS
jgi:hypothetical protein